MSEYRVVVNLKVKSQGVEQVIPAGTVITLSEAQAARLVEAGKVVQIPPGGPVTPDPTQARPYLDAEGDPVIPFGSDHRYHHWAGGQSLDATLKELWEERAAIREYEGRQTKEEAERGAWEDFGRLRDADPPKTDFQNCPGRTIPSR
jgi:hypothetical protein